MKKKRHDISSSGRLKAYIAYHSQLVAAILSAAVVLAADLAAFGLLKKIPDRIAVTWAPLYGEFTYSFRTEMIILIDLILFIIFFTIIYGLLKRIDFND